MSLESNITMFFEYFENLKTLEILDKVLMKKY